MKRVIIILNLILILSIVIIFSGCNKKQDIIIIKYAAWNLGPIEKNSVERQMINAFTKKHTNIKVEIDESFVKNYDATLKIDAENNNLPDVFMYGSNPQANTNGWCADITDIVSKDSEWINIPQAFREAVQVKGKIIAIPTSMYLYGYFYNEDLFKAQKVQVPSNNLSVNEFETMVKKMTNINNGSIGLADESSIIEWYPAAVNKKFGWYTWDGGKFNLNSNEFKAGVNLAKSIYTNKETYANLSEKEKIKLKG
ncbi:extracellular solute-binding protein, partial [Clostridium sp.]|uniref:ABC transporter substrate-binding protein n=1 Tax=Clostridium sp. TaxID=1506 RepID=UPI001A4C892B